MGREENSLINILILDLTKLELNGKEEDIFFFVTRCSRTTIIGVLGQARRS